MLHNCCVVCSAIIDGDRLNALINVLNLPPEQWKCKTCSEEQTKKVKGIYTGFSGASNMIFTDNVGSQTGIAHIFSDPEEKPIVEELD